MTIIDIILLIIIGIGAISGFMKGFFRQFASILGLIVGLVAAKLLYVSVAEKIYHTVTDSQTAAQVISFIGIWLIVPLIFSIVAHLLTKAFEIASLGWFNRLCGAALGATKYLLVLMLIIYTIEYIDPDSKFLFKTKKEDSTLYNSINALGQIIFPAAKVTAQQIYNQIQ